MPTNRRLTDSRRATKPNQTLSVVAGILGVVLLAVAAWYFVGGKETPLSQTGYEISKSLYAACNLQDQNRLAAVKDTIGSLSLSPEERDRVTSILELADGGLWRDATNEARELLQAQDTP